LTSTRAKLTPLLRAIQDLQQFHLIEYASDTNCLRLTPVGARTASTDRGEEIRAAAARALEG